MMRNRHLIESALMSLYFGFFAFGIILTGDISQHLQFVTVYIFSLLASLLSLFIFTTLKKRGKAEKSILFLVALFAIFGLMLQMLTWITENSYIMIVIHIVLIAAWLDIANSVRASKK